jgi:hypothetical protein
MILELRRRIRGIQLLTGLSLVIVGVVILASATPRIRSLITDLGTNQSLNAGDIQRWRMAKSGFRMRCDSPLISQGPGVPHCPIRTIVARWMAAWIPLSTCTQHRFPFGPT